MRPRILLGGLIPVGLALVATTGCSIHAIPFEDPSPRSFAMPRLVRQCIDGFVEPTPLTILDRGAEPRRTLRFAPEREVDGKLTLIGRGDDAQGELAVEHVLDVRWDALGAKGQNCYQFTLAGALDGDLEEESGPVMGVIGVGPHGAVTVGTDALDDASYAVEGSLMHRIATSQALVPSEPVGVGARWRFATEGHLRGEYVEIEVGYELLAHDGGHVRLGVERHVRRPAQTVRGRKGEGTRVEDLDRRERGIVEVDLQRSPLPSARWFDESGREVEQLIAAWTSAGG